MIVQICANYYHTIFTRITKSILTNKYYNNKKKKNKSTLSLLLLLLLLLFPCEIISFSGPSLSVDNYIP
jgi:hypothetical protein